MGRVYVTNSAAGLPRALSAKNLFTKDLSERRKRKTRITGKRPPKGPLTFRDAHAMWQMLSDDRKAAYEAKAKNLRQEQEQKRKQNSHQQGQHHSQQSERLAVAPVQVDNRVRVEEVCHEPASASIPHAKKVVQEGLPQSGTLTWQVRQVGRPVTRILSWNAMGKLGSGTYGHVYKVQDAQTHEQFAAKISWSAFRQELFAEHTLLESLSHANIVRALGFVVAEGSPAVAAMIQEVAEGSLDSWVTGLPAPLGAPREGVWRQLLLALLFLSDKGVVHCDLKPSNILVNYRWQGFARAVLCDFGLAGGIGDVRRGNVCTPGYRPIECVRLSEASHVTIQTSIDVWSVTSVLFFIATGRHLAASFANLTCLTRFRGEVATRCQRYLSEKQHCISLLLEVFVEPLSRPTARDLLNKTIHL